MPKVKIGAQINADDVKDTGMKRFNNGHKTYTTSEAKIMTETQTRERRAMDNFIKNKDTLTKPRNPLTGEITPRVIYHKTTGR